MSLAAILMRSLCFFSLQMSVISAIRAGAPFPYTERFLILSSSVIAGGFWELAVWFSRKVKR